MKTIKQIEKQFDKAMKPKVFCGGDHCAGMWNLPCDDINHNDGRELVIKSKAKAFYRHAITELLEGLRVEEKTSIHNFGTREGYVNCLVCGKRVTNGSVCTMPNDRWNQAVKKINQQIDQAKGGEKKNG